MKAGFLLISTCLSLLLLQGCSQEEEQVSIPVEKKEAVEVSEKASEETVKPMDLSTFERNPMQWGEQVDGVRTRMKTNEKKVALTFDACGGAHGSGYDEELISFLRVEQIPATLFLNERWIQANEALFLKLAADPLFQIENHGTEHAPLSVAGGEAWGIEATSSPQEAYAEIMNNHKTVKALTGKEMTLFRSGTAYYDEVAVQLARELGYQVVNYDVLGDAGATFSSEQVKQALVSAKEGSIALLHMNQPQSGTAEGVKQAVPTLREQGFEFVLLENEILQ